MEKKKKKRISRYKYKFERGRGSKFLSPSRNEIFRSSRNSWLKLRESKKNFIRSKKNLKKILLESKGRGGDIDEKERKKKEEGKGVKREKRLLASGGWQASNDTNHRVFASTAAAVAHYRLSVPPAVRLSEAPILAVTTVRLVILLRHPIADWSWPHLHRTHTSSSSLSLPSTPLLLPPSLLRRTWEGIERSDRFESSSPLERKNSSHETFGFFFSLLLFFFSILERLASLFLVASR